MLAPQGFPGLTFDRASQVNSDSQLYAGRKLCNSSGHFDIAKRLKEGKRMIYDELIGEI